MWSELSVSTISKPPGNWVASLLHLDKVRSNFVADLPWKPVPVRHPGYSWWSRRPATYNRSINATACSTPSSDASFRPMAAAPLRN